MQDFPDKGGGVAPIYYFGHFLRNVHEIKKKMDPDSEIGVSIFTRSAEAPPASVDRNG